MNDSYFTADSHSFHTNIIKYCNRPFTDIHQMNKTMADNINNVVCKGGWLYHLGDVAFGHGKDGRYYAARSFLDMLRTDINTVLIFGNHDKRKHEIFPDNRFCSLFNNVHAALELHLDGQDIYLHHYACRVWPRSHHGSWHLYAHSHGTLPDDPNALSIDVGVDCHKFTPLTFAQVGAIMNRKTWRPIDHHRGNYETNV
jgi:calcineurin-like phosphoesterase family protein